MSRSCQEFHQNLNIHTMYVLLSSGLTAKTKLSFTSSNSSFIKCVRNNISSFFLSNDNCPGPSYEGCTFNQTTPPTLSTITLFTRCTFSGMTSAGRGAAIFSTSFCTISLISCVLKDCTAAKNGGAVFLSGINSLTITNILFQNCKTNSDVDYPGGGGIYIGGSSSSLTIRSSSFISCKASVKKNARGGGGFWASVIQKCFCYSSRFISCSSNSAGGATVLQSPNDDFQISDCLFKGNTANHGGGAIREIDNPTSPTRHLKFSFFTANRANDNNGNDLCVHNAILATPFLHCFTTTSSSRVYNGNDNWLPQGRIYFATSTNEGRHRLSMHLHFLLCYSFH